MLHEQKFSEILIFIRTHVTPASFIHLVFIQPADVTKGTCQNRQDAETEKDPATFVARPCTFWLPGTDLNRQPSD